LKRNNLVFFLRLLHEGLEHGPHRIKRQDYFAMIAYMSRNPTGRAAAWAFYKNNFQKLVDMYEKKIFF